MEVRQREAHIDALRGLAIALVVVGHAIAESGILKYPVPGAVAFAEGRWLSPTVLTSPGFLVVYSFHMPLFAFLSGVVLGHRTGTAQLARLGDRFVRLMVPFFAWAAISWALYYSREMPNLFTDVADVVVHPSSHGALWYLYVLFLCEVVLALALVSPKPRLTLCVLTFLSIVIPPLANLSLFGFDMLGWVLPFFAGGYLLAHYREVLSKHGTWLGIAGLLVFTTFLVLQWPVGDSGAVWLVLMHRLDRIAFLAGALESGPARSLVTVTLKYGCAWAAIAMLWAGSLRLRIRHDHPLARLGRITLGVYATHQIIMLNLYEVGVDSWVALLVVGLVSGVALTLLLRESRLASGVLLGEWPRPEINSQR